MTIRTNRGVIAAIGVAFLLAHCAKERVIVPVKPEYHPADYKISGNLNFHGADANYHNDQCLGCHPLPSTSQSTNTCLACHDSQHVKDCGICHGGLVAGDSIHAHGKAGMNCNFCHAGYSVRDSLVAAPSHIDGSADLDLGTTTVCSQCHLGAADSAKTYFHGRTGTWPRFLQNKCNACHATTSSLEHLSGRHLLHVTKAGYRCRACHPGTSPQADTALIDSSRHTNGKVDIILSLWGTGGTRDTAASYDSTTKKCTNVSCHGANMVNRGQKYRSSLAWTDSATGDCGVCHASVAGDFTGDSHKNHLDSNQTWVTTCKTCHPNNDTTHSPRDGKVWLKDSLDLSTSSTACGACHGTGAHTAGTQWKTPPGTWKAMNGYCESCHDGTSIINGKQAPNVAQYYAASGHGHTGTFPQTRHKQAGSGFKCQVCHNPLASGHIDNTTGQKLLAIANDSSSLCLDCHSPGQQANGTLGHKSVAGASRHSYKVTGKYPSLTNYNYECISCHNPHGTANLAMIKPAIDGGLGAGAVPVAFRDSTKFDPTGQANDGVCDACHTAGGAPHARTAKGSNHNEGMACWQCHTHTSSFDTLPPIIQSLTVLPKDTTVKRGGVNQFRAIGDDQYGNQIDVTTQAVWSIRNTSVAVADATGSVTALSAGSTIVRVSSGTLADSTSLTVSSTLEMSQLVSIALSPSSPTVRVGNTLQFSAVGNFHGNVTAAITDSVSWASSNSSIAAIDSSGLVQGVSPGNVSIMGIYRSVLTLKSLTVNP